MNITVYLGANPGKDEKYKKGVWELGSWIAAAGHRLIYGGSAVGLMGVLADAVLAGGGEVIGVEPDFFVRDALQHEGITQLIVTVQSTFEFAREGWSAMYNLQGDEWVLPAGLVQHMADITIGATRGILAVRTEEAGFPRVVLPIMAAGQFIRNNLSLKRQVKQPAED